MLLQVAVAGATRLTERDPATGTRPDGPAAPAGAAPRLVGDTIERVTGTLQDGSTFEGRILNVDATEGQLSGTLVGTVTNAAGNTTRVV